MIHGFYGEYKWLSNFEESPVKWLDYTFKTNEHAYQASKCNDICDRERFLNITAGQAQRLGQKIDMLPGWNILKYNTMYDINFYKYKHNKTLRAMLKGTKRQVLIEGNWWHDNYWGVCTCHECKDIPKQNNLGKILMEIRNELK